MRVPVLSSVRVVLLMLLWAVTALALAAPPTFVYRGSTAAPEVVFSNGFPARGQNEDLLDHVNGSSCMRGESAYVPTSTSEAVAHDFAFGLMAAEPGALAYLYRIRAAGNLYSVDLSLREAHRQTGRSEFLEAADYFEHEQEWVAVRGIAATQVESVMVFQRNPRTGIIEMLSTQRNPGFIAASTMGNSNPLLITRAPNDRIRVLAPSLSFGYVSACFACNPQDAAQRRKRSTGDAAELAQCPSFSVLIGDKKKWVIDPITEQTVERHAPWDVSQRRGTVGIEAPSGCDFSFGDTVPGGRATLGVQCNRLPSSIKRYQVSIGAGGAKNVWVDARFKDGITGEWWTRSNAQIPVVGTPYTLASYNYMIDDIFKNRSGGWWSNITVRPYFPELRQNEANIELYDEGGFAKPVGTMSIYRTWSALGSWGDRISSIYAADDQRYKVCQHDNFAGKCAIFRGKTDEVMLNSLGLNNAISSIRGCVKPVPNTWQPVPRNQGLIGDIYKREYLWGKPTYYRLKKSVYGELPDHQSNDDWEMLAGYDEC